MGSDPAATKELGDLTMFLVHCTPSHPQHLVQYPKHLVELLKTSTHSLPSALRRQIT
jgi:protein SDA1